MKLTERLLSNLEIYLLIFAILTGQIIKIPFGLGGLTLLDLVILTFCAVGFLRISFKIKSMPKFIKFGLIFITVGTVSLLLNPLHLSLSELISSSLYLIRFTSYIIFAWLVSQNAFPVLKEKTSDILILAGFGLAVLGLLQLIFLPDLSFLQLQGWDPHYFRTVSTFLDPNFAGAYFVLTLLITSQSKLHLKWALLLMGVTFLSLLTTFSRSSYLMFLISFSTLSILKHSWKLAFITSIAFVTLIASYYIFNQTVSAPHGVNRNNSANARRSTWQQGFEIFQKNPIMGAGFNSYKFALQKYDLADQQFLNSRGATSNDSSLLFVLATTGIVGLTTYLLFLQSLLLIKPLNPILISGIAGLLVHSFFANSLFYPFILIWILLMVSKTFLK